MFNLHFSSIADTIFAEARIQYQDQNHHSEEILDTVNCFVHQRAPTGVPPLSIPPVPEDFLSQQIEGLSPNKAKGIDSLKHEGALYKEVFPGKIEAHLSVTIKVCGSNSKWQAI